MDRPRIDTLRDLVAAVGKQQLAYWKFFPSFADRLERELGNYLGDSACVAVSSASGEFSFDHGSYHHAGLGFEDGKFRVPLMFRLKNLQDEGDLQVRIRIYVVMKSGSVTAELSGEPPITVNTTDLTSLLEYIYRYLCKCFAMSSWFEEHRSDYQGTGIGFVPSK